MQINETSRTFVMDAHILRYLQEELGHKVNFDTIESVFEEVARTYHLIPGNLVFPVTGAWIQRRCSVGETRAYNAINALVEAKILVGTGYANPLRKRNREGKPRVEFTRYRWGSVIRGLFADARRARLDAGSDTVKQPKKQPENQRKKQPHTLSSFRRKVEVRGQRSTSDRPINPYPKGDRLHQAWWDELARLDREWSDGGRKGPRPMSCEVGGSKKGLPMSEDRPVRSSESDDAQRLAEAVV